MADFYKFEIGDWNVGTDNLTLEQEAAFLRVVNAIRLLEQPIKNNPRVLAGLWRCNERKAKRILSELIEAGKLALDGDLIVNERAVNDAWTLRQLKIERKSTGSRGGIQSAKVRSKSLKTKEPTKVLVEPEQNRTEHNRTEYKKPMGLEVFDPSRWFKDSDVETLEKLHPNIEVKIKLSDRSFQEWCFKNNPSDPRKAASNWINKKQTELDGLESLKVSTVQPSNGGASEALLKTSIVGGKKTVDEN